MSHAKYEFAPGAIAGIVVGTVFVLAVLSATCVILHRRRRIALLNTCVPSSPVAPLSKTPQRRYRRIIPRKAPSAASRDFLSAIRNARAVDHFGRDPEKDHGMTSASTLNVIVSPSLPRVFLFDTEGGKKSAVEVRVTPPTPCASRAEAGMPSPTKEGHFRRVPSQWQGATGLGLGITSAQSYAEAKW